MLYLERLVLQTEFVDIAPPATYQVQQHFGAGQQKTDGGQLRGEVKRNVGIFRGKGHENTRYGGYCVYFFLEIKSRQTVESA